MEKIKVPKVRLLEILKANRQKHRGIFELAVQGYREAALTLFEEQIVLIKANRPFQGLVALIQPVDQTEDYDRAIAMLEMSVDEFIDLSEADFRSYVQDKWAWKKQWAASNRAYSQTQGAMWVGEDAQLPGA